MSELDPRHKVRTFCACGWRTDISYNAAQQDPLDFEVCELCRHLLLKGPLNEDADRLRAALAYPDLPDAPVVLPPFVIEYMVGLGEHELAWESQHHHPAWLAAVEAAKERRGK